MRGISSRSAVTPEGAGGTPASYEDLRRRHGRDATALGKAAVRGRS
jgi:hypothetical protein